MCCMVYASVVHTAIFCYCCCRLYFLQCMYRYITWSQNLFYYHYYFPLFVVLCCHSVQFVAKTTQLFVRSLYTSSYLIQNVSHTKVSHNGMLSASEIIWTDAVI